MIKMSIGSNDIAVIGVSGIFPEASTLEEFHHNLFSKKDCVAEPSRQRLIASSIDPDKDYKVSGHLDRIDYFDHRFFNISKKEAEFIEPTQRLVLQLACEVIENAGYSLDELKGSNTGIFLSSNNLFPMFYLQFINAVYGAKDPTIHTGTLSSMIFGRMAYELQLTGPAAMIDTGCSSSLMAINEAIEKLLLNKIEYAIVGAVNLKALFFEKGETTGHLQVSSPEGKCRAFDADADGIGIGEGGGLLLLKRADKAIRDKDNIQALIKGIGISQDGGRSNSITAPSPAGQTQAITQAWENAGIDPETISYVETHGAGTRLGDVIEFQSLTDAFKKFTDKRSFCAISSVKSNIGHLGNAAGIAGVIKGILALKYKVHYPALHFNKPNPFIDFDNSSAFVNTQASEWNEHETFPRRCGVSSFGLSGTNSHLVLEEAPAKNGAQPQQTDYLLKVAAKSPSALQAYIKKIGNFLQTDTQPEADVFYTLNRGRSDYAYRTCFSAHNKQELIDALSAFSAEQVRAIKPQKQNDKKVIALFSADSFSPEVTIQLANENVVIKNMLARIQAAYGNIPLNSYQEAFAVQYGMYQQLLAYGIPVKTVMGTGVGSVVNKVITGTVDIEAALLLLEKYAPAEGGFKSDLFIAKVKDLCSQQSLLFAEMGTAGIFTEVLNNHKHAINGLDTICLVDGRSHYLQNAFAAIYNTGVTPDWNTFYKGSEYHKAEVPTYPFDIIRCWYDKPYRNVIENIGEWFYELNWKASAFSGKANPLSDNTFLVFSDHEGLCTSFVEKAGASNTCIVVKQGSGFLEISDNTFEINTGSMEDYTRLSNLLTGKGIFPNGIIYLNSYSEPYILTSKNFSAHLRDEFLPLYFITHAFGFLFKQPGFRFAAVSSNAYAVNNKEQKLQVINGMVNGLLKAMVAEYPLMQLTSLDVRIDENNVQETAALLIDEMEHEETVRFAAIRKGERFTPELSKAGFEGTNEQENFSLKEGGVYIITGGLTGIGLETARMFAETARCSLVITGRTDINTDNAGDESAAARQRAVRELQAAGAEVSYYKADVNNLEQMQQVVAAVKQQYNSIDGIVHAAGAGSSGVPIQDRTIDDVLYTLNPKTGGTIILDELTRDMNAGFFVCFSSIGTIVPSKNCADYTAANAFEDAYVYSMQLQNRKFMAINWADWKETGLTYQKNLKRSAEEIAIREQVVKGLTNAEGVAAIRCALSLQRPRLAVAKADLSSFRINPFFTVNDNVFVKKEAGDTEVNTVCAATQQVNETVVESATVAACAANTTRQVAVHYNTDNLTDTGKRVMAIWYEVLKLDNIGMDDDFYEIGGHSLNIIQLLNLLKKEFGIEVGLEEMLYNSTVSKLSERIDSLLFKGEAEKYEAIPVIPDAPYYDISHAQKRFWILNQLDGREAYNVPLAFVIKGSLQVDLLQRAFTALISRHESLRTCFVLVDGQPKQKVIPAEDIAFNLHFKDVSGRVDAKVHARQIIFKEAGLPFDLSIAPLLRAMLLQVDVDEYIFCVTMHHIVTDARSIAILKEEVLQFYNAYASGVQPSMHPLPVQYRDFVAWQNNQLSGERFEVHKNYWIKRLDGMIGNIDLPVDFNNTSLEAGEAGRVGFFINAAQTQQLKKLAERNSTTLFAVTLAMFKVLLFKISGNRDIAVATPVSGRNHGDLENQIGIYLNTLLLRTIINEGETFSSLLKQVKHNTINDFEHQIYPYDLLAQQIQHNPSLFNVGFTWSKKSKTDEVEDTGLVIEDYATGFVKAKTDLWMLVSEGEDSISCTLVFKAGLFREETISLIRERLDVLMTEILSGGYGKSIRLLNVKLSEELELEEQKLDVNFSF
jgi:acyl transferase domain-containing protein/acyl carrier protein